MSLIGLARFRAVQLSCGLGFILRGYAPTSFLLRGERIVIRHNTPDLQVAWSCLGHEFDLVFDAMQNLDHNFIIDAGGYIGTAAIKMARRYPAATIVTIEPDPLNFAILECNTSSFPNIVAIHAALMAPGCTTIPIHDRGTGAWGITTIDKPADVPNPKLIGTVPTVTVDDLLKRFGRVGIDILKLDIEGAEAGLLNPRPAWLDATGAIFAELHERIVPGCEQIFYDATKGRKNSASGEKILSLRVAANDVTCVEVL